MTPERPLVFIVLVNWNGLADTRECLASLSQITYPNARVLVVDNGSQDDQAGTLLSEFPAVTVLATGENLGFTGGNNVGIRHALSSCADYVLCLNNDTVVAPDFLVPLVQALEDDPKAGIATGAIYYHDQPEKLSALGCRVDLSQIGPVSHITEAADLALDARGQAEVAAVDGCVLLMRRAVAEATGGFDDGFFAYLEDADLCLRAREAGWHCLAVPASVVWHKVGTTTGGEASPTATHYYMRNSFRLVSRHGDAFQKTAFRRRFNISLLAALDRYAQSRRVAGVEAKQALDFVVNTLIGWLGCRGHREEYVALETVLRKWITLIMAWLKLPLSLYLRVYWKANSLIRCH